MARPLYPASSQGLLKGLLSAVAVMASLAFFPITASAQAVARVTFPGPDITLSGVLYLPPGFSSSQNLSAVVMLHGCSGMWSLRNVGATNRDGTPNLQNPVEKWGLRLSRLGVVALAVDSFTPRRPGGVASSAWQNQCAGETYGGQVDPYTTRAADALYAYHYLERFPQINPDGIGLLGWSHGAQAAMVQAAATSRTSNTLRPASDQVFAATVLFYPGCGFNLGFGSPATGYWRPYGDVRMNMGREDSFWSNCNLRTSRASNTYGAAVTFATFPGAQHGFDGVSQSWPTWTCTHPSNDCAMRTADVRSLAFLLSRITVPLPQETPCEPFDRDVKDARPRRCF